MKVITARNVNDALREALWWLKVAGVVADSRNGRVLMAPGPVTTVYQQPLERVMFSPLRDANPFFHLMESLWMLGGKNDVAFPAAFAKQIAEYSDDGEILHGAYGHRWRMFFGIDQIAYIINLLRCDLRTRRAVLTMWDAADLDVADAGGKDVPCNTHAYFSAVRGVLDMTVCCRSNDAIWGAYGANAVHFSMLQQFIAEAIGVPIGALYQVSNNLHIYTDRLDVQRLFGVNTGDVLYSSDDRYTHPSVHPVSLIAPDETEEEFLSDVAALLRGAAGEYSTDFFCGTVDVIHKAHNAHKAGHSANALIFARTVEAPDWRIACVEWLERRGHAK